jgi:hypothetical protein
MNKFEIELQGEMEAELNKLATQAEKRKLSPTEQRVFKFYGFLDENAVKDSADKGKAKHNIKKLVEQIKSHFDDVNDDADISVVADEAETWEDEK